MKRIKEYIKSLKDYRHWIMFAVIIACCSVIPFFFKYAHLRIWESCVAFGNSFKYYISELIGLDLYGELTVNDLTQQPFELPLHLPKTWEELATNLTSYWSTFFSMDNFTLYMGKVADVFLYITKMILIVMPVFLLVFIINIFVGKKQNNDYGKESKALQIFKKFELKIYIPIKKWIINYVGFVRDNMFYLKILAWVWAYSFNIIAIVISFFAYYFYFIVALNTTTLYIQFIKLLMDVSVVPTPVWGVGAFIGFLKLRSSIGYARLNHFEKRNRGFINERPIVLMVCGTMGKKKTTAMTDMALSQEIMFRDKAFEKILENDLKFPYFPFINLENSLRTAMEFHEIYNLATVRKLVAKKKARFYKAPCRENLFNYDYERYGFTYDDKLKVVDVWEVIETYAQLYFIYIIQSSLLISNYSVRVDSLLSDLGNFPLWNCDLFKRDSRLLDSYSRHAHIIDFDSLRLGRKVVENNRKADCFDFGVILITEVGKERGNAVELAEKKKKDDTTNQKNDLFNASLKMIRHSATVDNFPFVKVITDEQRPESWGADARDLLEIVHIRDSGESRLAMPFYSLESLIYELVISKFADLYYKYRYVRSDNTLPMYILKSLTAKIRNYHLRTNNLFGFCQLGIQVESGTQDGELDNKKYYLMSKKIYSKRFSTDCFSDFFAEKNLRSSVGINDLEEYATEKATFAELQQQNSYFVGDLLNGLIDKEK